MNRLDETAVSEIRAAEGVYKASDVARAYEVHRSTVTRIWSGAVRKEIPAAPEPPNVATRNRPSELAEDIRLLLLRGRTVAEVAEQMGISVRSVYAYKGVLL